MRGWIYVISNKSMPGLVKVGYSSKDPEERAQELDHTGTPQPYVVEYDILIEGELYQIEQHIHRNLSSYSEGKEWFRCTPEQAVTAIRQVAKNIAIAESFKKADREKAERLEREREIEIARQTERRRKEGELLKKEEEITQKYKDLFKANFSKPGVGSFFMYWLGFSFLVFCALEVWSNVVWVEKKPIEVILPFAVVIGLSFALIWIEHKKGKQEESKEYRSLIQKRDAELEAIKKLRQEL